MGRQVFPIHVHAQHPRIDTDHAGGTLDCPLATAKARLACIRWFWSRCSIPRAPAAVSVKASPALAWIVADRASTFQSPERRGGVRCPPTATRLHPPAQGQPVADGRHPGCATQKSGRTLKECHPRGPGGPASHRPSARWPSSIAIGASLVVPLQGTGDPHSVTQGAPLAATRGYGVPRPRREDPPRRRSPVSILNGESPADQKLALSFPTIPAPLACSSGRWISLVSENRKSLLRNAQAPAASAAGEQVSGP